MNQLNQPHDSMGSNGFTACSLLPSLRQGERKSAIFWLGCFQVKVGHTGTFQYGRCWCRQGFTKGTTLSGRADNLQAQGKAQHFPLCPTQVMKLWRCPRLQKSVPPFTNSKKSLPQKLGPQCVPILVKQFTSSEANASQNQEQLKRESF